MEASRLGIIFLFVVLDLWSSVETTHLIRVLYEVDVYRINVFIIT